LHRRTSAPWCEVAQAHHDWLTVIQLPAYAPGLNPVEGVWANVKNGLGNFAPGAPTSWPDSSGTGSSTSSTGLR
jgi:transposase